MSVRLASMGIALSVACSGPDPVRVAGLSVDLVTPADIDPLIGVDTLVIRVLDRVGQEITRSEGDPSSGVPLPLVTEFGEVEVEVVGLGNGEVMAAARTGILTIEPQVEASVDALFLPINEAVKLTWTPTTDRVGHTTLLAEDGRVLLIGGRVPSTNDVRSDSEWWDLRLGFDGAGPTLPRPISLARSATLSDGTLLVAGGEDASGYTDQVTTITAVAAVGLPTLPTAGPDTCVAGHPTLGAVVFSGDDVAVYDADGLVGVDADVGISGVDACAGVGGRVVYSGDTATGWGVLDVPDASWPVDFAASRVPVDGLPDLVGAHLVVLADGDVFVAGGFGVAASDATRRVDPEAATAEPGPRLSTARVGGSAARWRGRRVVLGGGYADDIGATPVLDMEIVDPAQGSLLTVPVPARSPSMTVLHGGTLLFTGGVDQSTDPAGAWAVVPYVGSAP